MDYAEVLHSVLSDLRKALSFCTRVPLAPAEPVDDGEVVRASWAWPVAGSLIGATGALVYWIAYRWHVPAEPAAMLGLGATILLTGAMHEDGLADTADGFGGGNGIDQKLQIMRDSRIGTYGACALVASIMLRWSAIAAIAEPRSVAVALVVAHAAARACLPVFMRLVPPARSDGLSRSAGYPPAQSAVIAVVLAAAIVGFGLGGRGLIIALLILTVAGIALARICIRQIGGQSGDVLGTMEQTAETAVLVVAAATL
jgi:adenosylcobinamide-GDP ribazoletransferase